MAYPASVITFTTKNTGDSIEASHPNTLQTEVAAIEQGLIGTGFAHALMPDADDTRALGSSAVRWKIHGSQLLSNTIPSTVLSTTGTASTNAVLTGGGWVPSTALAIASTQSPWSLLKASTFSSSSCVSTTVLDSVNLSGLTIHDKLFVSLSIGNASAGLTSPQLTANNCTITNTANVGEGVPAVGYIWIQPNILVSSGIYANRVINGQAGATISTNSEPWTSTWTMYLTAGSSFSSGALVGEWSVYKVVGQ